jgi:hypothetical protein
VGTVNFANAAPVNGNTVTLSSSDPSVTVPTSAAVASGATSGTFNITTAGVDTQTSVTITATFNGTSYYSTLLLNPAPIEQIRLVPTTVQGGQLAAVAIYLDGLAGPSGITVNMASSSTDAVLASATINIPQGAAAGNVLIHTLPVNASETVTISGTYNGTRLYRLLTLQPATLSGIRANPTALQGGAPGALAVYLNGPAGTGGVAVSLSSSSTDVTVPTSATVNSGSNAASVQFTTVAVSASEQVTLSATLGSTTLQTTITLNPPILTGINTAPNAVMGSLPTRLAVYLNGRTGPGGMTVSLSSNSADVTIASSVTIAQGLGSANVPIQTSTVSATEQVTITASLGSVTLHTTLTLNPAALSGLRIVPTSVKGGNNVALAVYLNGLAGPGGTLVTLSSGSAHATIQQSVRIAQGASAASVQINTSHVTQSEQVTLTATLGAKTLQTMLTINP